MRCFGCMSQPASSSACRNPKMSLLTTRSIPVVNLPADRSATTIGTQIASVPAANLRLQQNWLFCALSQRPVNHQPATHNRSEGTPACSLVTLRNWDWPAATGQVAVMCNCGGAGRCIVRSPNAQSAGCSQGRRGRARRAGWRPVSGWIAGRGIVVLVGGRGAADLDRGDDRFRQDDHGHAGRGLAGAPRRKRAGVPRRRRRSPHPDQGRGPLAGSSRGAGRRAVPRTAGPGAAPAPTRTISGAGWPSVACATGRRSSWKGASCRTR